MPNYRAIQYRRYHDSLVSEYFWQLENVIEVLRGRAPHQQRFKEATLSTAFSVIQNAGTIGSTVSAAGGVVLSFLGQSQESRRVETLTPEYLSGQWEELKKIVESTAEKAVERYRHFLAGCSEGVAVELGRVSAQRLWEYIPREKLSFTIENMLLGILRGKSGRWQDDWRNTGLTESAEIKRQTAEGALKHAGIAYCDGHHQWHYALHPRDKDAAFPKYKFMVLSESLAQARISDKKCIAFMPSAEQALLLENIWSTPIIEIIPEDRPTIFSSLTPEVALRLKQLETDWLSFFDWRNTAEQRLKDLQTQVAAHEVVFSEIHIDIAETKTRVGDIEDTLPEIRERQYLHTQSLIQHGDRLEALEQIRIEDILSWSHLTYRRNPSFQQRLELWSELEARFALSPSRPVVLTGAGGVGKSSLASEWAHTQSYTYKRWLAMDTPEQFTSLEKWAKELQLPYKEKTITELWAMIAERIRTQSWLIVLDNVVNYAAIEEGLSHFSLIDQQGILITSRDASSWSYPIHVDMYSQEEAVSYIQQQMAAVERRGFEVLAAQNLAARLSYHPLALELAMAQICSSSGSISVEPKPLQVFQRRFESQGLVLLDTHTPAMQSQARFNIHQTLTALWDNGLSNLSSDALGLLEFLSFLSAEGCVYDLLLAFFERDSERLNKAIRILRGQSLIKQVDLEESEEHLDAWSGHRLLQNVVREKLSLRFAQEQTEWRSFLTKSWQVVETEFPGTIYSAKDVGAISRGVSHGYAFLKHMDVIAKHWAVEISQSILWPWQAGVLSTVGSGEKKLVHYVFATESFNKALISYRKVYTDTPNHPEIAMALHNLGIAYETQGNSTQAIKFYEESLVMKRQVYADTPNHLEIAMTLDLLISAYEAQGNNIKVIILYEELLAMKRQVYSKTPNHPEIATILHNLAATYRNHGNVARAIKFYEESLAMDRLVYIDTPEHPVIAKTLHYLGAAYEAQGEHIRAIELYEESLAMKRRVYADTPHHREIIRTLDSLRNMYETQGDNIRVIELYEELLAMTRQVSDTLNHPEIAIILHNLGVAYENQGNSTQAIKCYEESLVMKRQVYADNPNHSEIVITLDLLRYAYEDQGDNPRAIKLYEEHLAMMRQVYVNTPNHPEIAIILNNLGVAYGKQGNSTQAIKFYEESLVMKRHVYADFPNDPDIAITLHNLGAEYEDQDHSTQAIKYYEESLAMKRRIYADTPHHSEIFMTLDNLRNMYEAQGDSTRVIKLYEESLAITRQVYVGTLNHPEIAVALHNLGVAYENQGNSTHAIKCYEESLVMKRQVYASSPNHPEIDITLRNLEVAYTDQGNDARVIELYEESLAMTRQVYADTPDHTEIAKALNYLGVAYANQGDTTRAIELYKESLAMKRRVYALQNHTETAITLHNLGIAYEAQDDSTEAIKFYEESLAMKRQIYSDTPLHTEIIETLGSLRNMYEAQGDDTRVIKLYEELLAMTRQVYVNTPNHPEIARALNYLGVVYENQGNNTRAIELYKGALAMQRQVYADTLNHPDIADTLNNLAIASSASYLKRYKGSFFHSRGYRKISELQDSLCADTELSPEQITKKVREAIEAGTERNKYFANFV